MAGEGSRSAAERLAGEFRAQGSRSAPPHRPRLFARTDRAFRLRAAGPALAGEGRGLELAQRKMEDPPRRAASRPRRQPRRLPPALGRAALCSARLLPLYRRGRSDRAARASARFPRRAGARAAGRLVRRRGRGGAGARRAAARRYRRRRPHRRHRRAAGWAPVRLPAAGRAARGLSRAHRRGRGCGGKGGAQGADRGLPAAGRSAPQRHSRRAGPGRDRSQHPSLVELARMRRHDRGGLRGGAAFAARRRQVHDRRQARRNRRRQSCRGRRPDAARQPVPQASRPAQEPDHLLAAAPEPELLLLRPVHRPDQPGAARRRSAPRQSLRARDRAEPDPETRRRAPPRGRGCSTGSCATFSPT